MTIIIYFVRTGAKRIGSPRCVWGLAIPTRGEGETSVIVRPLVFQRKKRLTACRVLINIETAIIILSLLVEMAGLNAQIGE